MGSAVSRSREMGVVDEKEDWAKKQLILFLTIENVHVLIHMTQKLVMG